MTLKIYARQLGGRQVASREISIRRSRFQDLAVEHTMRLLGRSAIMRRQRANGDDDAHRDFDVPLRPQPRDRTM
jgi:hypothetical protein